MHLIDGLLLCVAASLYLLYLISTLLVTGPVVDVMECFVRFFFIALIQLGYIEARRIDSIRRSILLVRTEAFLCVFLILAIMPFAQFAGYKCTRIWTCAMNELMQ